MSILDGLRVVNRNSLDRLFETRERIPTKQDVLVEVRLFDMTFFLGFDDLYRALLNTNIKIIDEGFDTEVIISNPQPQEEVTVEEPSEVEVVEEVEEE